MLHSRTLWFGFGLVLVLLVLLALVPRRELSSRSWALLRCFWPSWRFFDVPEAAPKLCVRFAREGDGLGDFRALLPAPRAGSLVLNATFNLELAYASLLEALLHDAHSCDESEIGSLPSYELVHRLARSRLASSERDSNYQFALFDADSDELLLLSAVHRGRPD